MSSLESLDGLQYCRDGKICLIFGTSSIIDNNSIDGTREFTEKLKDPRISTYLINNCGVIGTSRNLGIKLSKGDWICFLDSDDIWEPEKLKSVYKHISKENFDVICHNEKLISGSGKTLGKIISGPETKNFFYSLLYYGNRLSTSAASVSAKFIKAKTLSFSTKKIHVTAEDYYFWLKLAENGAKFKFVNEFLGSYRIHNDNNSSKLEFHNKCKHRVRLSFKNSKNLKIKNTINIDFLRCVYRLDDAKISKSRHDLISAFRKVLSAFNLHFKHSFRTLLWRVFLHLKRRLIGKKYVG